MRNLCCTAAVGVSHRLKFSLLRTVVRLECLSTLTSKSKPPTLHTQMHAAANSKPTAAARARNKRGAGELGGQIYSQPQHTPHRTLFIGSVFGTMYNMHMICAYSCFRCSVLLRQPYDEPLRKYLVGSIAFNRIRKICHGFK